MKLEVESKVQHEAFGYIQVSIEPRPCLDAVEPLLLDSQHFAQEVEVVDLLLLELQ